MTPRQKELKEYIKAGKFQSYGQTAKDWGVTKAYIFSLADGLERRGYQLTKEIKYTIKKGSDQR
jgi:hypothetical protein